MRQSVQVWIIWDSVHMIIITASDSLSLTCQSSLVTQEGLISDQSCLLHVFVHSKKCCSCVRRFEKRLFSGFYLIKPLPFVDFLVIKWLEQVSVYEDAHPHRNSYKHAAQKPFTRLETRHKDTGTNTQNWSCVLRHTHSHIEK